MKYIITFLISFFCIQYTQTSWQNFWHPLIWWQNRLSPDVKEIISHAASADDTDETRAIFAQALSAALDKNPDDIQRGSLLLRIYKHCSKKNKKTEMALALIKVALEKGANPNTCGRKNKSIVLKAHYYHNVPLMEMLIKYQGNLHIKDKYDDYIFHVQVRNNNKEMIGVFLKQKNVADAIDIPNGQGETALVMATKRGYKDIVHLLLEHNAQPDSADKENNTPLHIATEQGLNDIVQLLLEYNANPNLFNQASIVPLHTAIEQHSKELVIKLIAHNAAINTFDANGNSSLLLACKQGNDEIIQILIDHGADAVINKGNKQGEYPLFSIMRHALKQKGDAYRNSLATIKTMLCHGADTRLKDSTGHTLFTLASRNNALDVMDILKEHDPGLIDEPDKNGNTPLHNESAAGSYETVQYLLHYGAQINKPNKRGQTPLLYAMGKGQSDIATLLLGAKASVKHVDNNGNTIWHYLAFANETIINCNQIIIDEGSSMINNTNNDGDTPLHIATQNDNINAIRFFLNHGSRIDTINNKQQTVLHIAAKRSGEILKLFLEISGTRQLINVQDQDGNTPLHHAAAAGNIKCLQLLLGLQATVDIKNNNGQTPFILSCKSLQMATVRTLMLSKRVNPNKCDARGYAGIHYIAESGQINTMREFLTLVKQLKDKVYVDIDKGTKVEKQTALHIVTIKQCIECVELLIEAGANVNARDKDGNTPLHFACTTNPAICKLLLNSPHIKPNLPNDKSLTPLHYAVQSNADRCIDLLMQYHEINPNCEDDAQCTPLYFAFQSPYPAHYTKKLLQHDRIKPNYLKPDMSSLHAAYDKQDFELLTLLLSHEHIDLDIPNKDELTIWQRALYNNQRQKMLDILDAIDRSGDIKWRHQEKIRNKIKELKNPSPINPEYTQASHPVPLYPVLEPVSIPVPVQPSAPPAEEETDQKIPPPVNPEWDGKEYHGK